MLDPSDLMALMTGGFAAKDIVIGLVGGSVGRKTTDAKKFFE